jgi:hypothetical protein
MTPSRVAAIAALIASVGLSAFTPVMAQGLTEARDLRPHRMLEFRAGADGRFQFAQFSCAPKAAERMERRFDRLAQRLQLTDEQRKLYDAFMTAALTAQTDLADKCADLRPAAKAAGAKPERPDLLARMEMRLRFEEARLAAMNAAFPDFRAFYASLSDDQKSELFPFGHGRQHRPMQPRPGGLNG